MKTSFDTADGCFDERRAEKRAAEGARLRDEDMIVNILMKLLCLLQGLMRLNKEES